MNPEIGRNRDYYFEKQVLELTSEGYSTREAKRKAKRDNKKKLKKMKQQMKW